MLKTTTPPEKSIFDRLEAGDGKGSKSVGGDSVKLAKESRKLKGQKSAKSQKSSKSRKSKGKKSKK